jgi:hypothetical protein
VPRSAREALHRLLTITAIARTRALLRTIHRRATINPNFVERTYSMDQAKTHSGSCFCGAVQLTVTGEPVAMGYCHCESCRHWSAGPVNAFTLWPPDAVRITRGADNMGTYNKSPHSYRKWCKTCGGHILSEHPGMHLTDVYAAVIPDLPFKAGVHVHYQESVLPLKDGVTKLKDLPKEMGGSGASVDE